MSSAKKLEFEADAIETSRQAYQFYPSTASVRHRETRNSPYQYGISSAGLMSDSPVTVNCEYVKGQRYELTRSMLEICEFCDLQLQHLNRVSSLEKSSVLPDPDTTGGAWTETELYGYLDDIVKRLLDSPLHGHEQLTGIHKFFAPREGDVEVTETDTAGTAAEASKDVQPGLRDRSHQKLEASSMELKGASASIDALAAATTDMMKYISSGRYSSSERKSLKRESKSMLQTLDSLQSTLEQSTTRSEYIKFLIAPNGPIDKLREALKQVNKEVESKKSVKDYPRVLIWTQDKNRCDEILEKIQKINELIIHALQMEVKYVQYKYRKYAFISSLKTVSISKLSRRIILYYPNLGTQRYMKGMWRLLAWIIFTYPGNGIK